MDHEIDPRFQEARKNATRRKRKSTTRKVLLPLVGVVVVVGGLTGAVWSTWGLWSFGPKKAIEVASSELEVDMVALEQDAAASSSAFAAAFVDVAGDPMIIRFETTGTDQTVKGLSAPVDLQQTGRVPEQLVFVNDVMVSGEEQFITTLPSSQDDFAFFQAQRSGGATVGSATVPEASSVVIDAVAAGTASIDDADAGWGGGQEAEITKTRIENTTSIAFVRPEKERVKLFEDTFAKMSAPQDLDALLISKGFARPEAEAVKEAASAMLAVDALEVGQVVALRGRPQPGGGLKFAQLSIYGADTFYGTLALLDDGEIGTGSDPWVEDELFDYTGADVEAVQQEQKYRMLDAFYSAAIRNRVPSSVVGEAIALLSKSSDLNAFANPGDRMMLLYGAERLEEETGAGQLLYIALKGQSVDVECFVHQVAVGGDYACFGVKPQAGGGRSGMLTPVNGVLTSRFGPRTHPILKTVKVHKGVDWAAPTGTPIHAAFDGTISYAGDGGGYGNLVKIGHANGFETRYAHLNKFEIAQGAKVRAGDLIGRVGTTGRSTGPHLHFELYLNGKAVDPLSSSGGPGSSGGTAVETLVNQIIRVESAGDANAKNPLSTATGLGQFIESTWLRMMKTYRPDLAASMDRTELLALRTDPTISREMVTNLAREGESFLRARGHQITAGRLYLGHFLGAQGAHLVLSSNDDATLIEVLGAGVIKANPFLDGKNVEYVKAWAERKMTVRGRQSTGAAAPIREPKGLPEYRKEIQGLLGAG
jgi:murein DD-endopeptidase MepM/ murein hydrolase activator NlpD